MSVGHTLHDQEPPEATARHRKRALLRLVLGLLQITGASAGLYLLVRTGLSSATAIAVAGTLVVSIVSRAMFTRSF